MPHLLRRAALLAACAVVAATLAACGDDTPEATGTAPSTTTRPPALSSPEGGGSGTATTIGVPAPGTYTYDQSGTSFVKDQGQEPKPLPEAGTLEVDAAKADGNAQVQDTVRSIGDGTRITQSLRYQAEGVFIVSYTVDLPVVNDVRSFTCAPDRPVRILPANAVAGDHWSDRVDCGEGQFSYSAEFVAVEDTQLGDGTVKSAWRILVRSELASPGIRTKGESTIWFVPDVGLQARDTDATDAEVSVYDIERRAEDVLRTATPA